MNSSCKRSIRRNTTWSAIYISLQRNIPKLDTVLLHSNWSSLGRKYSSRIPTDVNALSCGPKTWKISGISDPISPARHPQNSSQHVRACAAGDGAICSKNRIFVPYHGDNSNIGNGARLRSQSPIMAPVLTLYLTFVFLPFPTSTHLTLPKRSPYVRLEYEEKINLRTFIDLTQPHHPS